MGSFQRLQTWQVTGDADLYSKLKAPPARKTHVKWTRFGFKVTLIQRLSKISNANQFVDVGANVGQTMLEIFSSNQKVEYFGFEPNPQAFTCLQELAASIQINANLFPWACGVNSQPASFYSSSTEDCSATLLPEIRPDTYWGCSPSHIASYPLDVSLKPYELSSCFIMKVDVEGFENEVLTGAQQLLKAKRPFVLCEVLHAHRDSEIGLNNARKLLLENLLREINYDILQICLSPDDRNTFQGLTPIDAFPKDLLWKNAPHTCDFLFIPQELRTSLPNESN